MLMAHSFRLYTGFESRSGRIFVIEAVQIQCSKIFKGLGCVVLSVVLSTIKNPWSHSIRLGHSLSSLLSRYCHDLAESDVKQYSLCASCCPHTYNLQLRKQIYNLGIFVYLGRNCLQIIYNNRHFLYSCDLENILLYSWCNCGYLFIYIYLLSFMYSGNTHIYIYKHTKIYILNMIVI